MNADDDDPTVKLVAVGDGAVGKTCLLLSIASPEEDFSTAYIPTVFDNHTLPMEDGTLLSLWDTAGQGDYDRLRPLSYRETDVFVVAYSANSRSSLDNVRHKWVPEVRHYCPEAALVLVQTKTDLLGNSEAAKDARALGDRPVERGEGDEVARELGADGHLACSALTREGVDLVFAEAVRAARTRDEKKKTGTGGGSLRCACAVM